MAEEKKIILTNDGLKKLEEELENLKVVRRKEVAAKIKEARMQGDLSENAEYDAAKEEQAEIETRITQIEKMLRNAEVIDEDELNTGKVNLGNTVVLWDKEFEEEINQSENPLKLAIQLAIVGNYIDCIAMPTIDDKVLNRLLMQYREIKLDDKIYKLFTNDLANSRKVIYCTDNCGEIVLDKLLIKYLTLYYPQLEIQVIVRGEEIGNDASIEDAENISMQEVAAFEGNGTTIAGTSLHLLSDKLKKKFYKADMIISKGQGNYETLSGSGLNIYYLFLCKCNHLQKIFLAKFLDPIFSMECERR